MKTFKSWLSEDAPANGIGGGFAVRGLGHATGDGASHMGTAYTQNNVTDAESRNAEHQSFASDWHHDMHIYQLDNVDKKPDDPTDPEDDRSDRLADDKNGRHSTHVSKGTRGTRSGKSKGNTNA